MAAVSDSYVCLLLLMVCGMSSSFVQLLELLPLAGIPDLMCSLWSITAHLAARLSSRPLKHSGGNGMTVQGSAAMGEYPISTASVTTWEKAFVRDPRQLGLYCFCRMNSTLMVSRIDRFVWWIDVCWIQAMVG